MQDRIIINRQEFDPIEFEKPRWGMRLMRMGPIGPIKDVTF